MNENPGTLIGLSNVMTRASARVAPGPDPDAVPGLRDRLRTRAMRALEGRESFIHDAVIQGRRVRLFSNSHHLADFWRENWPGESDWKTLTGRPLPRETTLTVHAMTGVDGEPEASYYSAAKSEVYLFNSSYYGDLRACSMEALGRTLSGEGRLLHGGAVESGGRMLLLLYPRELVHPTPPWGLLEAPGSRLLADGWLFRDTASRLHAIEKGLYLRTSFVESYPDHAAKLLRSKFENVPDAAPALADPKMPSLQGILDQATRNDPRQLLRGLPPDRQKDLLLRLIVSADSRVMVDPAALVGKSRVTRGPAAPAAVFDLKAGRGAESVRPAKLEGFACPCFEVFTGSVAGHPRELARLIAAR
jgi:hypothetical protein